LQAEHPQKKERRERERWKETGVCMDEDPTRLDE
jgi:hypothetical protein